MENKVTLRQWIENFNNGKYDGGDCSTQIDAGWHDWFCKDTSLKNKTKKMGNIIKKLQGSKKIDMDKMYVWFKNNCPMDGPLYDQFKISDIETGDVIYCINIKSCFEKSNYSVYGRENGFSNEILGCRTSKELINWFNNQLL